MQLLQCALPSLKVACAPILQASLPGLFAKAVKTRLPESNTSDIEKNLIESHSLFLRTVYVALEELGFAFLAGNQQILPPLLDYLHAMIFTSVEDKDRKHALRFLKLLLIGVVGI